MDAPDFNWLAFFTSLDTIRESRGLMWKDVAEQSGVDSSSLSRLKSGKTCTVEVLARLRVWMGVTIERFFIGEIKK